MALPFAIKRMHMWKTRWLHAMRKSQEENTSARRCQSLRRRRQSCWLLVEVNYTQPLCHITTAKLVSRSDLSCKRCFLLRQYAFIPAVQQAIQKMYSAHWIIALACAWREGRCPLWITIHSRWNETNLSSFQDNANKYQPDLLFFFSVFTLLSAHRAFLSFLRVEWKVSLLLRIKAEEKPGPGLIHVAHTGGMLCMDNWLLKQHGHRWILMVLPKCHLTDVTAAPILKRLVSKAPIQAHSSPTVSGRDSAVCQASISEGQILHLQPYLSRTVHPLPEGHWTFPIIGIYHSAFKVEIKSVGMVRGGKNRHNCIGFIYR